MKICFLGTNGWYDNKLGNTLCVLVESSKAYIIFDAGNGLYKLDKYIKDKRPIYLFLSHFHLDHIIGLHTLNKFNFPQGINVFGPKGVKEMFKLIINKPYSMPVSKLKTRVRIKEIDKNLKLPFEISFKELLHSTKCYGYRLTVDGKTIAFCTDTGYCRNISELSKRSALLIAESSLPPGKTDISWPHLNPQQAAEIAKAAGVKKLALVHFDAEAYPGKENIIRAQKYARKIFKNTFAAKDNFCLEV
jgi:ribonuclease BN (tRNA processing enzyme)